MIKAIAYVSNTGNTRRYAEMLSEKTGIPAYPISEAGKHVKGRVDEVFYMGWVRQGKIKDFARASMRFNIAGVCGVGMGFATDHSAKALRVKTLISDPKIKVFYAQGGFDMNKLTGLNKLMMGMVRKAMRYALTEAKEQRGEETEQSIATIAMLDNGADYVSEDKIAPIVEWIIKRNRRSEQALAEGVEKQ